MKSQLTHEHAALRVETVATGDRLEALAGAWAELWRRCPAATPFQSPHWLLPWWRVFGGAELCVFTVFKDGRLCALVPLFRYTDPENRRRLVLLGTGITDLQDALIEPGLERPVLELFKLWLSSDAPAWDEADFQQLPVNSPLLEGIFTGSADVSSADALARQATRPSNDHPSNDWERGRPRPLPPGGENLAGGNTGSAKCGAQITGAWNVARTPQDPCLVLSLPDSPNTLAGVIPGPMLKNLRYCQRRAREAGEISFELATSPSFEEIFAVLLRLHGARWGERGQAGVLADEAIGRFHRQAAAAFLEAGLLRLYALRLEGRIIACHYGFAHANRAFYYLGGFDPGFSQLSPGTLIVAHAISEAIREGACEFNFLRGRESYKYRWGARDQPCHRLQITNSPTTNNKHLTLDRLTP